MQRTERELTDAEIIDAFMDILEIIIKSYDYPVREDFHRQSRAAQIGYDIQALLLSRRILMTGKANSQQKLQLKGDRDEQKTKEEES